MTILKRKTSVPSVAFVNTVPKYAVASACMPFSKTSGTTESMHDIYLCMSASRYIATCTGASS
jgi:hypothetical protein